MLCCAFGCSNSHKKGYKLYRFPADKTRRLAWENKVKRQHWKSTDTSRLCEAHFETSMFEANRADGKKKLKWNAEPTIFSHLPPVKHRKLLKSRISSIPASASICSIPASASTCSIPASASICSIPASASICSIPASASICSIPASASTCSIPASASICSISESASSSVASSSDHRYCSSKGHVDSEQAEEFMTDTDTILNNGNDTEALKIDTLRQKVSALNKQISVLKVALAEEKLQKNRIKKHLTRFIVFNRKLKGLFNNDQFVSLTRKSTKGMKWSKNTIRKSVQLHSACGESGYAMLIKQGYPLPSTRTLRRQIQYIVFQAGILNSGVADLIEAEGQGEGYSQDSSPQVQVVDNKDRQVLGREKVELSNVCEAHSDDVGTLPNGGCSTESDQMFYVCEMNTELCVAGTSHGVQSNVEIKTHQKMHNTGKPFSCDVCGARFTYCSSLKIHKRIHTGERPYMCDVCGSRFIQCSHLKAHMERHIGVKPDKNDVCSLGFTKSESLKVHRRTHTGEKQYKCDVCNAMFTLLECLNSHKRTHTAEKPYKCDMCGVGFTVGSSLKKHKRTHTGEKPYKCDVCNAVFAQNCTLKAHKRTHTGEKPYKCDVCGVAFTFGSSLNKHKRKHT